MTTPIPYSKEERKLRKALGLLICHVRLFEAQADALYSPGHPLQGVERGKQLARYLNALTFNSDEALYFALGFDYKKDGAAMRKDGTNIKAITKLAARTKPKTL